MRRQGKSPAVRVEPLVSPTLTANLEEAMHRVRTIAAPRNAIRHEGFRTPCHKTGVCMDCNSPDRICNVWTITEKSYPAGRIKVILIGEELGL